jgi:hypothetical protein
MLPNTPYIKVSGSQKKHILLAIKVGPKGERERLR